MSTDTKGDIMRNYGSIASKYYGYNISVIDLRNPKCSHGNNLLHLVNKYMDLYTEHPDTLAYSPLSITRISPALRSTALVQPFFGT